MNVGRYTFVIDIPPNFQRDAVAGSRPAIQVNVDATALMHAGIGAGYTSTEARGFLTHSEAVLPVPVDLAIRVAFNPNVVTAWFTSMMAIIENLNMLAIVLAGAAVIREREHGTIDHLLVMPLGPFEIAMSKVWANGLVITIAVGLSLGLIVRMALGIPIAGSVSLFLAGVAMYLFFTTAIGIFLATIARSMPQFGLLFMLVALPMNLLSGTKTPFESMPVLLRSVMQASPSTHFASLAQAILFRGAGFDVVWPHFVVVAAACFSRWRCDGSAGCRCRARGIELDQGSLPHRRYFCRRDRSVNPLARACHLRSKHVSRRSVYRRKSSPRAACIRRARRPLHRRTRP